MVKKCVYCSRELSPDEVVDVCTPCGHGVWGEKMFNVIRENMEGAREAGHLHQGSVTDSLERGK